MPMKDLCLFVSDLHGKVNRYEKLFKYIEEQVPGAVFLGGDLLPASILHSFRAGANMPDFVIDFLALKFRELRERMQDNYPHIFIILGNDDPRIKEAEILTTEEEGLWHYIHGKIHNYFGTIVMGYSFVPPTPFLLKDWEKFDMEETVRPGCLHPNDGFLTTDHVQDKSSTIMQDLDVLSEEQEFGNAICVFHSPPYNCCLDKAALDGVKVEGKLIDPHVGSIAIKEFIAQKKPRITLHGHIHEASRLTGSWKEKIYDTIVMSAAYEGPELAVVRFTISNPEDAQRIIL